ncbi:MAG: hypothetical protein FD167_257 [bacterium]|nr:MAG: hypothetical protein FD167_257 [bacterium]
MLGVKKDILFKVLAIVVCVVIWLSYSISYFWVEKPKPNQDIVISQTIGSGRWEVVSGGLLRDIRRIAFDNNGKRGVAVSLEGHLLSSEDGGLTWDIAGKMSFSEDGETWSDDPEMELINALAITDKGLFIGTAVDESSYGAIYQLDSSGKWRVQAGNYGGLLAASNNSVMIGSKGLMIKLLPNLANNQNSQNGQNSQNKQVKRSGVNTNTTSSFNAKTRIIDSQNIAFQQLPLWAQINLYSIDQKDENLLIAGDYGIVCNSTDSGKSWKNISPDKANKLPLYGAVLGNEIGLVGGSGGSFWRLNKTTGVWQKITGLKKSLTIFAIYADKEGHCVAGGGDEVGNSPFIVYSSDNGLSWQYELIPQNYGRVVSVAKSANGVFVATLDGHILLRKNNIK